MAPSDKGYYDVEVVLELVSRDRGRAAYSVLEIGRVRGSRRVTCDVSCDVSCDPAQRSSVGTVIN